jgi:hypothetical protein
VDKDGIHDNYMGKWWKLDGDMAGARGITKYVALQTISKCQSMSVELGEFLV